MLLVYILTAPVCLCSKELLDAFLPCLVSPIGPLLCAARKAALMVPKKLTKIKNIFQMVHKLIIYWSTGRQPGWVLFESKLESKSTMVAKVSETQWHNCHLVHTERWDLSLTLLLHTSWPGNIRGWFLTTRENSAAAVLYLHGVSATRAYAPRVLHCTQS